jgi:phosphoribosylglycinamide formyltransferase-1
MTPDPESAKAVQKSSDPPIAVLISGRGSNLGAILGAIRDGRLRARVAVVISNRPDAAGLALARTAGVETLVMPHRDYDGRAAYDAALIAALRARAVHLVCLAGFMRRLGPAFCAAFPNAVLNIHPSLLPAFPGVEAQQQALDYGVKVSGATVHLATPDLDAGPIVLQEPVPILEADTAALLAERILAVEHRLYPEAIARVLAGGWRVEGRRVVFEGRAVSRPAAPASDR